MPSLGAQGIRALLLLLMLTSARAKPLLWVRLSPKWAFLPHFPGKWALSHLGGLLQVAWVQGMQAGVSGRLPSRWPYRFPGPRLALFLPFAVLGTPNSPGVPHSVLRVHELNKR